MPAVRRLLALTSAAIALPATQSLIESIQRLTDAGADSIVFQPLDGDEDCLEEYIQNLIQG